MKKTIRDIIRECGGPEALARASKKASRSITEKGVYSWHRIGIPAWHWPLVMALSSVSERDLLLANEELREERAA